MVHFSPEEHSDDMEVLTYLVRVVKGLRLASTDELAPVFDDDVEFES